MAQHLVIVESPNKVKKIQSMLGSNYLVAASVGHVRDLPAKSMGVEPPDFKPAYEPTEQGIGVLKRLAELVRRADDVYLATDPDREGEAIAWHLASALRLKKPIRVAFHEITESAVKKALATPGRIDAHMVAAQEARRVLDRFCGYLVSGPLSRAAGEKLSAGRVQSPALRLIVEREREIASFQSTTHFGAALSFQGGVKPGDIWTAQWITSPWLNAGSAYLLDKSLAERAAAIRDVTVTGFEQKQSRSAPPAPFTTSTLQQVANAKLGLSSKVCMGLAQKLFEGGHVTYIRTDSPNLSQEATEAIRAFCVAQGWPLSDRIRTWKAKEGAQEGHECIRPTHIENEECGETEQERDLYRLIRMRALASQLEDAVSSVRVLTLRASLDGREAIFEARGSTMVSPGFRILSGGDEEEESQPKNPVPQLDRGTALTAVNGVLLTKKTAPPPSFTEGTLVEELERLGIGRPSTFASIIQTLFNRAYITTEKKKLKPLPTGCTVVDRLRGSFTFLDYRFTRHMEEELDGIAEGKTGYGAVVGEAYAHLLKEVEAFMEANPEAKRQNHAAPCDEPCLRCGKPLEHLAGKSHKTGKNYDFFKCSHCETIFANDNGKPCDRKEGPTNTVACDQPCPACDKPLEHLTGISHKTGKAYDFFKCKGCGGIFQNSEGKPVVRQESETTRFKCPKCKKPLIRHQNDSYDFYGCSGYPKCREKFNVSPDGSPDYRSVRPASKSHKKSER